MGWVGIHDPPQRAQGGDDFRDFSVFPQDSEGGKGGCAARYVVGSPGGGAAGARPGMPAKKYSRVPMLRAAPAASKVRILHVGTFPHSKEVPNRPATHTKCAPPGNVLSRPACGLGPLDTNQGVCEGYTGALIILVLCEAQRVYPSTAFIYRGCGAGAGTDAASR